MTGQTWKTWLPCLKRSNMKERSMQRLTCSSRDHRQLTIKKRRNRVESFQQHHRRSQKHKVCINRARTQASLFPRYFTHRENIFSTWENYLSWSNVSNKKMVITTSWVIHIVFRYLICAVLVNFPYRRAIYLQVLKWWTSSLLDKNTGHLSCHELKWSLCFCKMWAFWAEMWIF